MREIKFRGIGICGSWNYGYHYKLGRQHFIRLDIFNLEVVPETVGQYTGFKDKNGVEIYEGDIIETETGKPMPVVWNNKFASFCLYRDDWAFAHWFGESTDPQQCIILGNIHQHGSLLKTS